jgi:hypothetical protein
MRTFGISALHPHHGEMGTSGLSAEDAWYLCLAWMARVPLEPELIIKVVDEATGQTYEGTNFCHWRGLRLAN